MSSLPIVGIGTIPVDFTEYLSLNVLNEYTAYMTILKTIYDKRESNPNSTGTVTPQDYDTVVLTVQRLAELGTNGRVEGEGSETYTSYLTEEMAKRLNDVMQTLKFAGINASSSLTIPDAEKVQALKEWQALAGFGGEEIMEAAVSLEAEEKYFYINEDNLLVIRDPTRTLQSMVELEYVKRGNDIFFDHLQDLEEALNLTNDILNSLRSVENIANMLDIKVPTPPSPFTFPPVTNDDLSDYAIQVILTPPEPDPSVPGQIAQLKYQILKDAYDEDQINGTNTFAEQIAFYANADTDDFKHYYKISASSFFTQLFPSAFPASTAGRDLAQLRILLYDELEALETQNPDANRNTTGSLAQAVYFVIQDISTYFGLLTPSSEPEKLQLQVAKWIIDKQDALASSTDFSNAGAIQTHILRAIGTAQSTGDTQRDDVRRYLYIFQEFYKSASAVLQKMGEMFDKIFKGIEEE